MEAVAHRLVLLIVHLQEQHIRILLRKLANLRNEIDFSEQHNLVNGSRIGWRVRSTANSPPFLFTPLGEEHGNRRSQGRRSPRWQACRRRRPMNRRGLGRIRSPACWAAAPSPTTSWISQSQGSCSSAGEKKQIILGYRVPSLHRSSLFFFPNRS